MLKLVDCFLHSYNISNTAQLRKLLPLSINTIATRKCLSSSHSCAEYNDQAHSQLFFSELAKGRLNHLHNSLASELPQILLEEPSHCRGFVTVERV
jgi:hypothetical protein